MKPTMARMMSGENCIFAGRMDCSTLMVRKNWRFWRGWFEERRKECGGSN